MQLDTIFNQNRDLRLRLDQSISQRISGDLVSKTLLLFTYYLVEKPFMQPHKDYDDYTKFINDTYSEKKTELLNQTFKLRRKSEVSQKYNPLESMRTYSEFADKEREFSRTTQGFYKAKTAKKSLAK